MATVNDTQVELLKAALEEASSRTLGAVGLKPGVVRRKAQRRPYVPKNGPRRGGLCLPKGFGWLHLVPKELPPVDQMLDDISCSAKALATVLGVSEATVYRWVNGEAEMSRVAQLAIFWITSWGQQRINAAAHNDACLYAGMTSALRRIVEEQGRLLRKLGEVADFGAANDPSQHVPVRHRERSPEATEIVQTLVTIAQQEKAA